MAITSITTVSGFTLAYRPIVYQWSSNAANLKYCIVEILDDNVRIAVTSVQMDEGSTTNFTIDISDICQNLVNFTLKSLNTSGVLTDDTALAAINIKVYEVTEDPSTKLIVTNYDPDIDSNNNYEYESGKHITSNWMSSHLDYASFSFNNYKLTSSSGKFLTKSPSQKNIELDTDEFLGLFYHAGIASKNFKVEVLTYNSSNALLNTDYINITNWNTPTSPTSGLFSSPYISIAIGTKNLINSGISLTNVSYYTVQIINDDGDMSEVKRYNIVDSCSQDVRIHWVNSFGKQDSFTFKGNKQEEIKHDSNTFTKAQGITYSSESRGITVLQNISNSSFTAYSKSIGRDEYHWLSSIFTNKEAWVEIDDKYFPIIIEDGSFFKTDESDMPIQFILNYSFANKTKGLKG